MADFDLNQLQWVQALAQTGSFTAAADKLGSSKTRISLQLRQLEQQLGVSLFHRTTRQVRLTEAGEQLLEHVMPHYHALLQGLADMQQARDSLSGHLVVSAPEDFAAQVLVPIVAKFHQQYPQLTIELRSSDQVRDLVKEGIDVAIRVGWLTDSSLVARRLGRFEQWLLAAPSYLASHGQPQAPTDLTQHQCIVFTLLKDAQLWRFQQPQGTHDVRVTSQLLAGSTRTLTAMLVAGCGVGMLTDYAAAPLIASGQLVRLLPTWQLPDGGVYAVYPPGSLRPAKVRQFIAALETNWPTQTR